MSTGPRTLTNMKESDSPGKLSYYSKFFTCICHVILQFLPLKEESISYPTGGPCELLWPMEYGQTRSTQGLDLKRHGVFRPAVFYFCPSHEKKTLCCSMEDDSHVEQTAPRAPLGAQHSWISRPWPTSQAQEQEKMSITLSH